MDIKKEILDKVVNSGFVGSFNIESSIHSDEEFDILSRKFSVEYIDRHKERDFLILANGPSLKDYKSDIDTFIAKYNPVVMGANYLGGLFKPRLNNIILKKSIKLNNLDIITIGSTQLQFLIL